MLLYCTYLSLNVLRSHLEANATVEELEKDIQIMEAVGASRVVVMVVVIMIAYQGLPLAGG
jgi:hypothetical protein